MSRSKRIVHLKQSGELLTDQPGERWTASALKKAAGRIAEVQKNADRLGVAGLMIVSGGGNVPDGFGRGDVLRQKFGADSVMTKYADVIGRRSTIDNAIMLSAALLDARVEHVLMAAPGTAFRDQELGQIDEYDVARIQTAYKENKVVLMAGGTGKGGQTTDTGVVELAMWQAKAHPEIQSLALKMTKFNGVFTANPVEHPDARQYVKLSAKTMLDGYDRLGAVDRQCLEVLKKAGDEGIEVFLRIYAAEYSIVQALENANLGTIVTSLDCEPKLA